MNDTLKFDHGAIRMVAHRGCSALELENTASAFVAAGNRSYWGIETDVHVTRDGQFIIFHDDNTGRVAGDKLIVEETSYETLRSLRLMDKDGKRGRRDLIMPSLEEYVAICKKYDKYSVLELKNHMEPAEILQIVEIVRAAGQLEKTVFISFDLRNMLCIRKLLPEQKAQYLAGEWSDALPDILKTNKLDLDIRYTALTKERVDVLHEHGIEVNVWTVDKLEDCERMKAIGVDYITSNACE